MTDRDVGDRENAGDLRDPRLVRDRHRFEDVRAIHHAQPRLAHFVPCAFEAGYHAVQHAEQQESDRNRQHRQYRANGFAPDPGP